MNIFLPICRHHLLMLKLLSSSLSTVPALTSEGLLPARWTVMCSASPKAATEHFRVKVLNCCSLQEKATGNIKSSQHGDVKAWLSSPGPCYLNF